MNARVGRRVLALLVVGLAGTLADLLLLSHVEDLAQRVPVGLLVAALVVLGLVAARPRPFVVRAWQATAALLVASGVAGMALHLKANMEFQREMDPSAPDRVLLVKAVRAKAPPALAPGAMVMLGLLGLLYRTGEVGSQKQEAASRAELVGRNS